MACALISTSPPLEHPRFMRCLQGPPTKLHWVSSPEMLVVNADDYVLY